MVSAEGRVVGRVWGPLWLSSLSWGTGQSSEATDAGEHLCSAQDSAASAPPPATELVHAHCHWDPGWNTGLADHMAVHLDSRLVLPAVMKSANTGYRQMCEVEYSYFHQCLAMSITLAVPPRSCEVCFCDTFLGLSSLVILYLIRLSSGGPVSSMSSLCYLGNLTDVYTHWYWWAFLIDDHAWILFPPPVTHGDFTEPSKMASCLLTGYLVSCRSHRSHVNTLGLLSNI